MNTRNLHIIAAACLFAAAATSFGQDVPYQKSHSTSGMLDQGSTRLIYPARLHREVEVSRSLAAQPVHPYMAHVQIGGGSAHLTTPGAGGAITTYIDPMRRLDGDGALDVNHSLVKAQRLHRSLSGTTTEDLAALTNASLASEPRGAGSNRARLVLPPQAQGYRTIDQVDLQPVLILPAPQMHEAPSVPHRAPAPAADDKLLANNID